jgi:hypothetical protein
MMLMKKYIPHILITTLFAGLILWQSCGMGPSPLPLPLTGSIRITAVNLARPDSFYVILDTVNYGKHENPCLFSDIVIGFHKLFIQTETTAGSTKTVEVLQNQVTAVDFWLESEGPYVGNTAPNFTANDINGNPVSLEGLKGKVVLLALFEHT